MSKLVILDRDGVINYDSSDYIKSPEEWLEIPGSLKAIALLNKKDFLVAIATNQSGIGRGYYSQETLYAIHKKFFTLLKKVHGKIDKLVFCPHTPKDNCLCRKPKPGMVFEILTYFNINPTHETVYFVGDSKIDMETAIASNCKPILVRTGNGNITIKDLPEANSIFVFDNLLAFAKSL
jgi:D-glycero-D-manno-heptose 1,7-bisphosphate phosphatase